MFPQKYKEKYSEHSKFTKIRLKNKSKRSDLSETS